MKKILFVYCLLSTVYCFAQQSKIDSLQNLLKSTVEDTSKINLINQVSRQYINRGEFEQALKYSVSAVSLSESLIQRTKNPQQIKIIKEGSGNAYNNAGLVYFNLGEYDKSVEANLKAMAIREEIGDKKGIASSFNNLGMVSFGQGYYDKALNYYLSSLTINEEIGNKPMLAKNHSNIGLIYFNQKKYEKALDSFLKGLIIKEEIGDRQGIAYSYGQVGNVHEVQRNFSKALDNYSKSLAIMQTIGNKRGIAEGYANIGNVYKSMGNISEAEKKLKDALTLCREIGYKDGVKKSYSVLSDLYAKQKDFKKAYDYHQRYSQIKDSLLNEESSKQIAEMQTKYETEKKEQQITLLNKDKELQDAQLNRQKIVIWSVAGGLLVVLVLSVFIFRERRKSEKLLLNILPAETARELKAKGKATARHYDSVTVMFTDFKDFTTIAEKLSAEELVSELDFLFKKFDEIISKYNIEKIKTIGDAYMCAGGLPTANKTNAIDVVSAAIEIQRWMISQNNKWSLRIGIHSGPVTAGVVGDKKFAYDIWGDTVNTASRMESSGEAGKINISGVTHQLIKDTLMTNDSRLQTVFRGKIPAKNKGEIEMYFVDKNS